MVSSLPLGACSRLTWLRSISRDPDKFPEPERFNPFRWLDPSYPTYAEPLTHHPTITGYSQFGYGRRVCQGQAVADADLFVGIGSIAWLFHISKDDLDVPKLDPIVHKTEASDNKEKGPPVPANIAEQYKSFSDIESVEQLGSPPPPPSPVRSDTSPIVPLSLDPKSDPTLRFSSLLIAKPTPFEFNLKVRSKERADFVMAEYAAKRRDGEFEDARVFWEEGGELGWGKV
jgi:hypothetical protein